MSPDEFEKELKSFERYYRLQGFNNSQQRAEFSAEFDQFYRLSNRYNIFWRFCSFQVFEEYINRKKESFLIEYNATTTEFAEQEIQDFNEYYVDEIDPSTLCYKGIVSPIKAKKTMVPTNRILQSNNQFLIDLLGSEIWKRVFFDEKRKRERLEFLLGSKNHLKKNDVKPIQIKNNLIKSTIEWDTTITGSKTDFIRLCKGLYESEYIKADSQKSFINQLSKFFNIEINNDGKKEFETITKVQEETNAKIFDSLKLSLKNWRINTEEKKDQRK